MTGKRIAVLFGAWVLAYLTGCGVLGLQADITQYVGTSEKEIRQLLGEPTGIRDEPGIFRISIGEDQRLSAHDSERKLVYQEGTSLLPKPLTRLEMTISPQGVCTHLRGQTVAFQSPERLLSALGLGGLEKVVVNSNEFAITYRVASLGLLDVYHPSGAERGYRTFNVRSE